MTKPVKRLFLFAGYDRDKLIDNTLVDYLKFLSPLGDIILTMDSDIPESELKKLDGIKNLLHVDAHRHGEYDFGSYKRGYQFATGAAKKNGKNILKNYDWVYLVNDSVYCLYSPEDALLKIESSGAEYTGMVETGLQDGKYAGYIQSWFIGFSKRVANSDFFADFINSVTRVADKGEVVQRYEVGISPLMAHNGVRAAGFMNMDGHGNPYTNPLYPMRHGCFFIKKTGLRFIQPKSAMRAYTATEDVFNNIVACDARVGSLPRTMECTYKLKIFGLTIISYERQRIDNHRTFVMLFGKIKIAEFRRY